MLDIVIVGAGMAGLTCAYRLQQAGLVSYIFEGSERLGGRMYTARGVLPAQQTAEYGGEFIDSDELAIRQLVTELALPLVDLSAIDEGRHETYYFGGRHVELAELLAAFQPLIPCIEADLNTLTGSGAITYDNPRNAEWLDRLSIADWFDRWRVRGLLRDVLEAAYVNEFGREIAEQSALNLLTLIGRQPGLWQVYGHSDERFRLAGGSDQLTQRIADQLWVPPFCGRRLQALAETGDGYRLSFETGGDVTARCLVLALPFSILRTIDCQIALPERQRLAIDTLGYGTNAKLITVYQRPVWHDHAAQGTSYSTLGYLSSWEATRGQLGQSAALTHYLGGLRGERLGEGSVEDQADRIVQQIEQVFPGSAAAYSGQALRMHWPTQPFVQASYSCYLPGQWTTLRGVEGLPVGRLYFCGEHTSLIGHGKMNGAVESAERAASALIDQRGR